MTPNTSVREIGSDRPRCNSPASLAHSATCSAGWLRDYLRRQSTASLDGTLLSRHPYRHVLRQARSVLVGGEPDPKCLPAAIVREVLENISSKERTVSPGGIVPIGPRKARLWWSPDLAGDDVLAGLDAPQMVARFFDITGLPATGLSWNQVFDIPVDPAAGGQTLDFWASDREYRVEIGLLHADGRYERLAGVNPLTLPRDSMGENGDYRSVLSRITGHSSPLFPELIPDEEARRWAAARPDFPGRDLEAELTVHMLYRAFQEHGPAILRQAPGPQRASPEHIREEFDRRMRDRMEPPQLLTRSRMVAVRFEAPTVLPAHSVVHPMAVVAAPWFSRWVSQAAEPISQYFLNNGMGTTAYAAYAATVYQKWEKRIRAGGRKSTLAPDAAATTDSTSLVQAIDMPAAESSPAHSVFLEAEALRHRLAAFRSDAKETRPAMAATHSRQSKPALSGVEVRRFERSGARLTKIAFMLEGTVRPGTRLRIAGKTIQADSDGKFRVECPFNGRKTVIPIVADDGMGRQATGRVTIDWDKRATTMPLVVAADRT